jgi:hypothetical protein
VTTIPCVSLTAFHHSCYFCLVVHRLRSLSAGFRLCSYLQHRKMPDKAVDLMDECTCVCHLNCIDGPTVYSSTDVFVVGSVCVRAGAVVCTCLCGVCACLRQLHCKGGLDCALS